MSSLGQAGSFICSSPEQRSKPARAMDEERYSNGSGTDLPGSEQETDGENHVLKHTAFPA